MPRGEYRYLEIGLSAKILAEDDRLVREFIVGAGGWVTQEGLVVVPNRPPGWRIDEWPTFAIMDPERLEPRWHTKVDNNECRDKAALFLSNLRPQRSNHPGGVLVLCPAQ